MDWSLIAICGVIFLIVIVVASILKKKYTAIEYVTYENFETTDENHKLDFVVEEMEEVENNKNVE